MVAKDSHERHPPPRVDETLWEGLAAPSRD